MKITIWDNKEKSLVYNKLTGTELNQYRDMKVLQFKSVKSANKWIEQDLASGNYIDMPSSVYKIIKN